MSVCPECGERARRSHHRSLVEWLVKNLTRHRAYRCHHCGWRGWLMNNSHRAWRREMVGTAARAGITFLLIAAAVLIAVFVVNSLA